jgi:hypothetical protein
LLAYEVKLKQIIVEASNKKGFQVKLKACRRMPEISARVSKQISEGFKPSEVCFLIVS